MLRPILYISFEYLYTHYLKKTDYKGYYYWFSGTFVIAQILLYLAEMGNFWTIQSVAYILVINILVFIEEKRKTSI